MKPHPYLRAYMAGTFIPTLVVMFIACAYAVIRFGTNFPIAIERGIVFPVAFVPNLWGIWNVMFLKIHQRHAWPLGAHGALLPFVLAPLGLAVAGVLSLVSFRGASLIYMNAVMIPYGALAAGVCCAVILYYFVWKYLVSFLNDAVGIA